MEIGHSSPGELSSPTNLFVAGNDPEAKAIVIGLLTLFGWTQEQIVDLGDITGARGMEAYLLLRVRMMQAIGTAAFNVSMVTA